MRTCSEGEILGLLRLEYGTGDLSDSTETIHTHISTVLLVGSRALKLKRPVRFPYLDLSTPERRLRMCERELRLNRRTAPQLYRAVHRITREADGRLALNGRGPLVDAVLEMGRFDNQSTFDRLAAQGKLAPTDMEGLARGVAALHEAAEVADDPEGAARMQRVLQINERAFAMTAAFAGADIDAVNGACRSALARHAALLDERAAAGHVRRCHGDLHLRNIARVDGGPLLFDCLEFDEDLATTDVLYDLAFVLMDLWRHGLRQLANTLFNRYLDETGDEAGISLLPFFMAVRGAVRAHVTAADASTAGRGSDAKRAEARAYLELCRDLLQERPPFLAAIGGFSGSGKSTVAAMIAPGLGPAPGARLVASDRIRKRMFGVSPETRLPENAYVGEVSDEVYRRLRAAVCAGLAQGHAAIADAVFDREEERLRIASIAMECGVPFQGIWLEARPEVLIERVAARRGDVSDATPDVVAAQCARGGVPADWASLRADQAPQLVAEAAKAIIERSGRTGGPGAGDIRYAAGPLQPDRRRRPASSHHGQRRLGISPTARS